MRSIIIFIINLALLFRLSVQCPCFNGGTCSNDKCQCSAGWTGKNCQSDGLMLLGPCVDIYKSCKSWDEESRCQWTVGITAFFLDNCPVTCNQCVFNKATVPKGLPLPPILEPLQFIIGVWETQTDQPDRFPVKFSSGGYKETIEFLITEVPGFDTPSLNYTSTAISLDDPTDQQHEIGFLWMRPGISSIPQRQIGNMISTNTGVTVIQEGILNENELKFNSTTYSQILPSARNSYLDENVIRILKVVSTDQLVQTVTDSKQFTYTKTYKRVAFN